MPGGWQRYSVRAKCVMRQAQTKFNFDVPGIFFDWSQLVDAAWHTCTLARCPNPNRLSALTGKWLKPCLVSLAFVVVSLPSATVEAWVWTGPIPTRRFESLRGGSAVGVGEVICNNHGSSRPLGTSGGGCRARRPRWPGSECRPIVPPNANGRQKTKRSSYIGAHVPREV